MTKQMALMFAAVGIVSLTACGKGGKGGKGETAEKPLDAGPINAAIPAAWKGKIEFAVQAIKHHDDSITAIAPKGWKAGFMPGELEPPDGNSSFGFGTNFGVAGTCGGSCESKDAKKWESIANKSFFANMLAHTPPPKVAKDETTPGKRSMIAEDTRTDGNVNNTSIIVAWWADDAKQFDYCNVTLAPESKDLTTVFAMACEANAASLAP